VLVAQGSAIVADVRAQNAAREEESMDDDRSQNPLDPIQSPAGLNLLIHEVLQLQGVDRCADGDVSGVLVLIRLPCRGEIPRVKDNLRLVIGQLHKNTL
jgi:hypothetical protein